MSTHPEKTRKKKSQSSNSNKSNPSDRSSNDLQIQVKKPNKEIQIKHFQSAKDHIQYYESSSEEEEELETDQLLESVFKGYNGNRDQLRRTQEFLEHVFQSGASTCLICIGTVKRTDYVSNTVINSVEKLPMFLCLTLFVIFIHYKLDLDVRILL